MELREAHRYHKGTNAPPVAVGDIVVVHGDEQPRTCWKLGKVEQVITGRDGEARAAVVKVCNRRRTTTLQRPIQRLYPLEVNSTERVNFQAALPDAPLAVLDSANRHHVVPNDADATIDLDSDVTSLDGFDPTSDPPSVPSSGGDVTPLLQDQQHRRPKRAAARVARDGIFAQALDSHG